MAEGQAVAMPGTQATDASGEAADRAARVSGLINAILASPSVTTIQAALADPEINAAALSDNGVSQMVGMLSGAGNVELAKQVQMLQPTAEERQQIVSQIAAAPKVETNASIAAAGALAAQEVSSATASAAATAATTPAKDPAVVMEKLGLTQNSKGLAV